MMTQDNYLALQYNKQVLDELGTICQPLFNFSGNQINAFSYHRFFNDNTHLTLCNRLDWMQYYLYEAHEEGNIFPIVIRQSPAHILYYRLWPNNLSSPILKALYDFNMWNGLSVYRRSEEYLEVWSFSSTRQNEEVKNFYINHLDDIRLFLNMFNYKAIKLLNAAIKVQLTSFKNKSDVAYQKEDVWSIEHMKGSFEKELNLKKILITTETGKAIYLTKREYECLSYLSKGGTYKEVARILSIDARTVEFHANTLKRKFGADTKSSLIRSYLKSVA